MVHKSQSWDEESFEVLGYYEAGKSNGQDDGIEVIEHNVDNNTLLFSIQNTTPTQFSLIGTHEYIFFFPLINN